MNREKRSAGRVVLTFIVAMSVDVLNHMHDGCARHGGKPKSASSRSRAPKPINHSCHHFSVAFDALYYCSNMEDKESIHLEIQEGTSSTGEVVWKDAGPIHLLDNPQQLTAAATDDMAPPPNQRRRQQVARLQFQKKQRNGSFPIIPSRQKRIVRTYTCFAMHQMVGTTPIS